MLGTSSQTEYFSRKRVPSTRYRTITNKSYKLLETLIFISYSNTKFIGTVKLTLTASPFCLPGIHLGIDFTTRIAS